MNASWLISIFPFCQFVYILESLTFVISSACMHDHCLMPPGLWPVTPCSLPFFPPPSPAHSSNCSMFYFCPLIPFPRFLLIVSTPSPRDIPNHPHPRSTLRATSFSSHPNQLHSHFTASHFHSFPPLSSPFSASSSASAFPHRFSRLPSRDFLFVQSIFVRFSQLWTRHVASFSPHHMIILPVIKFFFLLVLFSMDRQQWTAIMLLWRIYYQVRQRRQPHYICSAPLFSTNGGQSGWV